MFSEVLAGMTHSQLFEVLFLLKGRAKLPTEVQKQLHVQLMRALYRQGCFQALCEALLPESTDDDEVKKSRWHCCAVISKIVGRKGYSKEFYPMIIDEIVDHIDDFVQSAEQSGAFFVDAAVECLTQLFSIELNFIRRHICKRLFEPFECLASPTETLTGAIVLDERETVSAVQILHTVFCVAGPSHVTLPSELCVPFVPLFVQLHDEFDESSKSELKSQINAVIVKCLSNRDDNDLNRIIDEIMFDEHEPSAKVLHQRVKLCLNARTFAFKMFPEVDSREEIDFATMYRLPKAIVSVLKSSNHNVFIYKVFIHVLRLLANDFSVAEPTSSSSAELLSDSDELALAIRNKFKKKLSVIYTLSELIEFKSFHSQFNENPRDICEVLNGILEENVRHIEQGKRFPNDDNLFLVLTLAENLLQMIRNEKFAEQLKKTLRRLRGALPTNESNVLSKLSHILEPEGKDLNSEYSQAKKMLCEDNLEPYVRVQGIMTLLKLIEARDEDATLNKFEILALAMKMLRSEDSYVFLNCIKLLAALMNILEQSVLDALVAEYHYDFDADAVDIDYKLKIGETIVKVVSALGEMNFKHKDTLVNCFLRGCYHKKDEFRTSNVSNLGNICRILSYQIHSFFQEVISKLSSRFNHKLIRSFLLLDNNDR